MLDERTLASRIAEERIKAEMLKVYRDCEYIVGRFDQLDREPTADERARRRIDFISNRKRLGELGNQLLELRCPGTE